MFAALLTATLLTATPQKVTFKLSVGGFMGSVWAAQSYRDVVFRFRDEALSDRSNLGAVLDSPYLVYTAPVLGPWMTLARGGQQAKDDMWLLLTSGVLQGIGLSMLTYQLFASDRSAKPTEQGLELSVAPYVAGRLGIAVTLTGF